MDWESFETIITNFMENPDNEYGAILRAMIEEDPDSVAVKLVNSLGSVHNSTDWRECCAGLLMGLVTKQDLTTSLSNLSVSSQSTIKSVLLDRIMLEESKSIISWLCHIISDLAAHNDWPELLPFLHQCVTDSTSTNYLKQSAFLLYVQLADKIGETVVSCVKNSRSLFLDTLKNDDLDVRIAATMAGISFIQCVSSLNEKERFQDLLPGMMRTLTEALSKGDQEDAAADVLRHFIELARNDPKFLRPQLVVVIGAMFEIAENKSLEEETRILPVEFMLSLVEGKEKVPGMMKKVPLFTNTCFAILLNLLLDIKDDDPRWHTGEPIWHSDEPSLKCEEKHCEILGVSKSCVFGLACLERFSIALGGKTTTPIAIEQLPAYLVAPEWEKRHAALLAIAHISEGSSKVMIRYLDQFVNMVLRSSQDPHPRVRWAALHVIHQFLVYFSPYLQEQYHSQILSALSAAMDDHQNPRLQECATAAVVIFCKSVQSETIEPYVDGMLKKLVVLLQNDIQIVNLQASLALAAIADLSKEHFHKYYDFVMPYLKTLLVNANEKSDEELGRNTFQCISSVGMAVGKEKFSKDLKQVMEALKSFQESQVKEFDTIPYSLMAWLRICSAIGKDFLPYMSIVMPLTVEFAQLEPDQSVSSDEIADSIHKVKLRDEIISIRGDMLLWGKAVACSVLGSFAETLEEDFYPWIPQVASVLVPLMKFYDQHIREVACKAVSPLLLAARLATLEGTAQGASEYFMQLSGHIILAMGDTLSLEPETEVCATILHELNTCLTIGGHLLDEAQVGSIMNELKHVIVESSRRKGELTERVKSEDFDAEEAELMKDEREQEVKVFSNVGHILVTFIKILKASFLPFLDQLSSCLIPTTGDDKITEERNTCIYVFDQLVEDCGEAALKYFDTYLPFVMDWSNDENPGVRQNALYGLGLCAERGGSVFKPFVREALSRINVVITHSNALEPENIKAYNYAVSALGKICQFHRENIDSEQIIPAWLNCLPTRDNLNEAKAVLDQLCSMVERSDREILGPNYLHLPKVISIFTEVLCAGDDVVTEETANRMIRLLRHFKETLPPATLASARDLLLPQQEMELESILSPDKAHIMI